MIIFFSIISILLLAFLLFPLTQQEVGLFGNNKNEESLKLRQDDLQLDLEAGKLSQEDFNLMLEKTPK